ncbi:MAG: isoprenylcysteine carboxylmethyltransferase family protein [Steroidobacteraceae bacterium]
MSARRARGRSGPQSGGCPASATHSVVAWSGVICMLLAVTWLNFVPVVHVLPHQALIVMAAAAFGVFAPDLLWQKVQRRMLSAQNPGDWARSLTKLLGLAGSLGCIALLYWLFPEYAAQGFYANFWEAMRTLLPLWAIAAVPYIYWVDQRLAEPRDALWQMGRLLLGQWQDVSGAVVWQHLLGWLVKGYYLPLMFTYFCGNLDKLLHYDLTLLVDFKGYYDWAYFTLYFIDVALVSMTYLMSLKLTDTHIRSAEPTCFGWLVALICYEPFWSVIGNQYLGYGSNREWGYWFGSSPTLYALWGSVILLLVVIYVWATIAFGGRFSNLTHRGIITSGPYRYTKHPAYLAKNLSWWLVSMPFMFGVSALASLRCCALLLMLNGVYYLRAKTEERHLSLDPDYRRYAQWIDEHGLLRRISSIPLLGALARWRPEFSGYRSPASFRPDASA